MGTWKEMASSSMHNLLYWSGASQLYASFGKLRGAVILMYHSVCSSSMRRWHDPDNTLDEGLFRRQMLFLGKRRKVLSMSSLCDELNAGHEIHNGTVVVTFDDGYLDNLEVAAPILQEYGIPALVYLATGYIDQGRNQWIDELYVSFQARRQDRLFLPGMAKPMDLSSFDSRRCAYEMIKEILIQSSMEEREKILGSIKTQLDLKVNMPRLTMNWEEVKKLQQDFPLVEMGVHSVGHLDLCQVPLAKKEKEIIGCVEKFTDKLGYRPKHFSFPYGRWDKDSRDLVSKAGLLTAVASGGDVTINKKTDLYRISRISAPLSYSMFGYKTSGAYPALSFKFFGRA